MSSWRTYLNLTTIGVVSLAIVVVVAVRYAGGVLFGDQYPVTVAMERAGGIVRGQEVAVMGRLVGVIDRARLTDTGVELDLEIQGDKVVPETALVQIMRRSAVGEQVLNFIPVEPDFTPPEDGRILPEQVETVSGWKAAERGALIEPVVIVTPIELPRILESAVEFFDALPPDELGTLIAELDAAVGGRGDVLRELNRRSADLNETFVDGIPEFERLIDTSQTTLAVLEAHADELASSFSSLADVSATLAENRPELDQIVTHGRLLTDEFDEFLVRNQANLSCLFEDFTAFNDRIAQPGVIEDFARMLDFNHEFWFTFDVQTQWDLTRDTFQWQRVFFLLSKEGTGLPYEPHRATPATKPGAACESPFGVGVNAVRQTTPQPPDPTSPGIDYAPLVEGGAEQPTTDRDDDRAPLPATGGGGALALIPALLAGAYVIGRRR